MQAGKSNLMHEFEVIKIKFFASNLQFEANYTRSTVAPSLISTTIMPILNSTAISNQTALNATVQNVTNSFSSASSEYFNRYILEIHKSDGIHDLGIIKWEMASK
jgi:hypothetical protein